MSNAGAAPLHLAGRFRRLIATTTDAVLVPALTILLIMVFGVVEHAEDNSGGYSGGYSGDNSGRNSGDNSGGNADYRLVAHMLGLAVLSYLLLNGYDLWRHGQTQGKKLCGGRNRRDRSWAGDGC